MTVLRNAGSAPGRMRAKMSAPAEVRVDRNNFSKEGNAFKLMYGWTPTDTDRRGWMSYEYQTTWSFFGGKTVEGTWTKGNSGALTLAPPYQKHTVEVQGDPDAIATAGVRTVTVKLYYKVGDTEQVKQVTLNPAKGQLSEKLDLVLPGGSDEYDYEITWQLKGNKVVTSGRKHSSTAILFVDDVTAG